MTTIAWDGRTLAADKRCVYGEVVNIVTKIHRAGDCLVGGSGEFAFILAMVEWVRGGRKDSEFPADQRNKDEWQPVLVIDREGRMHLYERTCHPIRWERRFGAIGSGKAYAIAAMHLGLSAEDAVAVACEYDPGSGNGIDVLRMEEV